ncbi:hypothetical protein EG871_14850 [Enterococcus faecium]|nr:hypothetical protein EG871_14850 [Enterococcus faecium]
MTTLGAPWSAGQIEEVASLSAGPVAPPPEFAGRGPLPEKGHPGTSNTPQRAVRQKAREPTPPPSVKPKRVSAGGEQVAVPVPQSLRSSGTPGSLQTPRPLYPPAPFARTVT